MNNNCCQSVLSPVQRIRIFIKAKQIMYSVIILISRVRVSMLEPALIYSLMRYRVSHQTISLNKIVKKKKRDKTRTESEYFAVVLISFFFIKFFFQAKYYEFEEVIRDS